MLIFFSAPKSFCENFAVIVSWRLKRGGGHCLTFGMRVLAIDIGTVTGYAVGDASRVLDSGVLDCTPGKGLRASSEAGMIDRYVRFQAGLNRLAGKAGFDVVAWEDVKAHSSVQAGHVYGGLVATLMLACNEWNAKPIAVNVKTIKKHATGNGSAMKSVMVKRASSKFNIPIVDDNHADALWLLNYVQTEIL